MLAATPNSTVPIQQKDLWPWDSRRIVCWTRGARGSRLARMGLEHEFFLVDRSGEPRDLADLFLRECREAARAEGLDPHCFKAESAMGMVEITTPPTYSVGEMSAHYLDNLGLALGVASELDLALYPLGTYPLR